MLYCAAIVQSGLRAGSPCGDTPAEIHLGCIPLCWRHERAALNVPRRLLQEQQEQRVEADRRLQEALQARYVTYFVHRNVDGIDLLKIGRTTQLKQRLAALNGRGTALPGGVDPGPVELVATVSGDKEALFHERFASLRFKGTEWFLYDEELQAFVAELNRRRAPTALAS